MGIFPYLISLIDSTNCCGQNFRIGYLTLNPILQQYLIAEASILSSNPSLARCAHLLWQSMQSKLLLHNLPLGAGVQ
jgi:hypothetical protein